MDNFHYYMKEQLKHYIRKEEKKGIDLEQIEQSLLNAGHDKNIIDECFEELTREESGLRSHAPKGKVQNDLVSGVKTSIKSFFGSIKSKEVKKVKKEIKEENSEDIVEEAIEEYEVEKERYIFEGFSFFAYLVALVILTLYTAGSAGEELLFVALGFSPAFLNSFISFGLIKFAEYVPLFMLLPVVAGGGFYALGSVVKSAMFSRMEVEALAIINVVMALFFNLILIVINSMKPKPIHEFHVKEPPRKEHEKKEIAVRDESLNKFHKNIQELRQEFNIKK
ncbi:hypothetical protein JXB41_05680 [Candidatus Woesearchaeota archaeon]|nr:hypothetical protein [Candidatus Woesearchaeota archaeon]